MHLKQIVNAWNWDSSMYNDISTRFLLMYSKQFFSQCNHSKREYGFINFYLCLLLSQEFASFCLTAQILLRMWSVLWLKFTWLNAHLYILVHICWNCIYNRCTIQFWLQKNFSSNLELETKWFKVETHAIINSWIGRPNTCHGVYLNTQIIFLNW